MYLWRSLRNGNVDPVPVSCELYVRSSSDSSIEAERWALIVWRIALSSSSISPYGIPWVHSNCLFFRISIAPTRPNTILNPTRQKWTHQVQRWININSWKAMTCAYSSTASCTSHNLPLCETAPVPVEHSLVAYQRDQQHRGEVILRPNQPPRLARLFLVPRTPAVLGGSSHTSPAFVIYTMSVNY